jgi:hypothetical protein
MNQRHRRHGGRGSTLLYYIGLEGKEDRRTEGQKTEGQKNRKKGRQKDRRTKEQKKGKETCSYLPFLMPPTSSLFSMVISVFFTEVLSLPKR